MSARTVVTIGTFDGVHVGHGALLQAARRAAGDGGRVVAMAFDPHPLSTLRPEAAPPRLTSFGDRESLLLAAGADEVVRLEPKPDLLGLPPEAFIERVVADHAPTTFVEGRDFRFGRGRAGGLDTLRELGSRHGFTVEVVPTADATMRDLSVVPASSSLVRWLLAHGRVGDAALVLGRPYALSGIVVRGDRRGREIGYPTANIEPETMTPMDGVYAANATLPDGRRLPAAASIGDKPTFTGAGRAVEAYIPGWGGPLAEGGEEYGWPLRLELLSWVRGQVKYPGVEPLLVQMERDVREVTSRIARIDAVAMTPQESAL